MATCSVRKLGEIPSGMALGYALSEDSTVYAGIYPTATLVSYNPATDTFTDHGALNEEIWPQYPRPLSVDASGWQAPRCMTIGPDGNLYALFREAVALTASF